MPNGILGTFDDISYQPYFVVQNLADDSSYYLFNIKSTLTGPSPGLYYSFIDMRLDGGLGDVDPSQKMLPVQGAGNAGYVVTGTRHHNNKDVWIVTRDCNNSYNYLSYLITGTGINTTPIQSQSTVHVNSTTNSAISFMRISPDGTKLFCMYDTAMEYCNFNSATGVITPLFHVKCTSGNIGQNFADCGGEWSINNKYLYVTYQKTGGLHVCQFDATLMDSAAFKQSKLEIDSSTRWPAQLQRGPDYKIYFPDYGKDSLDVIDNPSIQGTGCHYQKDILYLLPTNEAMMGFPQFLQKYYAYIQLTGINCSGDSTHFTSSVWPQADSIHWDFGDLSSGTANYSLLANPAHYYSTPGTYTVELFVKHIDHRTDTTWKVINILANPHPALGPDKIICTGDNATFDAGACAGCTYLWKNLGTGLTVGNNQTYTTGLAGTYSVRVTNSNGCNGSDTVQLITTLIPAVTNNPLSKSICTGQSTNISLTSSVAGANFHWTASLTSGNITGFSTDSGLVINQVLINLLPTAGTVTYQITPKYGSCSGTAVNYVVTVNPGDSVKAVITVSANNICAGTVVTFTATPTNPGTTPYYQWKINGINMGMNSTTYSYPPLNGDVVKCILTNFTDVCALNNPAISNSIVMIVSPNMPAAISISASSNPSCQGDCVTYTASTTNGGTNPQFQWLVNGHSASLCASCGSVANGLVSCFPFNGNAQDVMNLSNTGISYGATLTTDRFGLANSAYSFNGINNYIKASSSFLPTAERTISLWFKANSLDTYPVLIAYGGNGSCGTTWFQGMNHGGGANYMLESHCEMNFFQWQYLAPPIGQWYHWALTTDNSGCKMYVNGVLVASNTNYVSNTFVANRDLSFGACVNSNGIAPFTDSQVGYFNGKLDDISIYNRALTNVEIQKIYQNNDSVFTYSPNDEDTITCMVISSINCPSNNLASSNKIIATVNPVLPLSITITASANPFCLGSPITFTGAPVNGSPTATFQWMVNGVAFGTNNSTYTYNPANGDQVTCILSSTAQCITGNPSTSNTITMIQNNNLPAGVTITASANPFCPGSSVTFTALPSNGGTAPTYQWKVNGVNAGTNSTYTYNPMTNDSVRCIIHSNLSCVTGNPASSAEIIMNGTLAPIVTFTACFDTITTVNAKPIKLKGGIPLGGTYSGPGVNSITSTFNPATAGIGTKTITYSYTNAALCTASKHISILNLPSSIFTCGNTLTDVRDNKTYQTVQIGTQCWMSEDLNYGTEIPYNQDQRDNCVAEKYHNPASSIQHPASAYQWDEMMQYDDTPADQGFCPPGWHVPTENDWNFLFANYTNSALAGSPLKASGFSGFNALLSGMRNINSNWDLNGFAGFYWSSSAYGSAKAWAHGMNEVDPSVSRYPALRVNAFSVRCVKD